MVVLDATLCKTVEGGPEQFSPTHNYVTAGDAASWRLRCGGIDPVIDSNAMLKFTSLRAFARPRSNTSCQDAAGGGPPLQVTMHFRDPYKGPARSTPFTCNMVWGNSIWTFCQDVHTSSSSGDQYVEFYTSRGDCWDISGAYAGYEP